MSASASNVRELLANCNGDDFTAQCREFCKYAAADDSIGTIAFQDVVARIGEYTKSHMADDRATVPVDDGDEPTEQQVDVQRSLYVLGMLVVCGAVSPGDVDSRIRAQIVPLLSALCTDAVPAVASHAMHCWTAITKVLDAYLEDLHRSFLECAARSIAAAVDSDSGLSVGRNVMVYACVEFVRTVLASDCAAPYVRSSFSASELHAFFLSFVGLLRKLYERQQQDDGGATKISNEIAVVVDVLCQLGRLRVASARYSLLPRIADMESSLLSMGDPRDEPVADSETGREASADAPLPTRADIGNDDLACCYGLMRTAQHLHSSATESVVIVGESCSLLPAYLLMSFVPIAATAPRIFDAVDADADVDADAPQPIWGQVLRMLTAHLCTMCDWMVDIPDTKDKAHKSARARMTPGRRESLTNWIVSTLKALRKTLAFVAANVRHVVDDRARTALCPYVIDVANGLLRCATLAGDPEPSVELMQMDEQFRLGVSKAASAAMLALAAVDRAEAHAWTRRLLVEMGPAVADACFTCDMAFLWAVTAEAETTTPADESALKVAFREFAALLASVTDDEMTPVLGLHNVKTAVRSVLGAVTRLLIGCTVVGAAIADGDVLPLLPPMAKLFFHESEIYTTEVVNCVRAVCFPALAARSLQDGIRASLARVLEVQPPHRSPGDDILRTQLLNNLPLDMLKLLGRWAFSNDLLDDVYSDASDDDSDDDDSDYNSDSDDDGSADVYDAADGDASRIDDGESGQAAGDAAEVLVDNLIARSGFLGRSFQRKRRMDASTSGAEDTALEDDESDDDAEEEVDTQVVQQLACMAFVEDAVRCLIHHEESGSTAPPVLGAVGSAAIGGMRPLLKLARTDVVFDADSVVKAGRLRLLTHVALYGSRCGKVAAGRVAECLAALVDAIAESCVPPLLNDDVEVVCLECVAALVQTGAVSSTTAVEQLSRPHAADVALMEHLAHVDAGRPPAVHTAAAMLLSVLAGAGATAS